jgi:hypothetical protein
VEKLEKYHIYHNNRRDNMIKRICDRCKKEIKGNYWTINIYEKEDTTMRLTTEGAVNNMKQNMRKIFSRDKEYCKECIEEIQKVINNEKEQD